MPKRKCKIVLCKPGKEPYAIAWVKNDREMSGYYDAELYQICSLKKYGYKTKDDALFLSRTGAYVTGLALKTEDDCKQFKDDYKDKFDIPPVFSFGQEREALLNW